MIGTVVTLFLSFIFLVFYVSKRRPKNYPKGPYSWPIFGNMFQLSPDPYIDYLKLGEKYGSVFAIDMGSLQTVVVNDPKLIKEVFNHTLMGARPEFLHFMDPETGLPKGIVATEGKVWMEQRRFVLKTLRDFGFGKKSMESLVHEEIKELTESLRKNVNKPLDMNGRFNIAVFNALWTIVAGERYSQTETKVQKLIHHLTTNMEDLKMMGLMICFPWLTEKLPEYSGLNAYRRNTIPTHNFIKEVISEHKKTFQSGSNRDLIDCYLEHMNQTTDPESSFHKQNGESQLVMTLTDIFLGGTETTSYTLTWVFLLLAHHPDIQEKLHEEIKNVVGDSRLPSFSDKPNLPYLEAVLMEVFRYSSLAPLAARRALEDFEFHGYFIPKGTSVFANLYAAQYDPETWGDPENFRPERFLNEDRTKAVKNEASLPFGYGRRFCPGESLARDQVYLFTASLFQRFKVSLESKNVSKNVEVISGAVMRFPKPEKVVLQDRLEVEQ